MDKLWTNLSTVFPMIFPYINPPAKHKKTLIKTLLYKLIHCIHKINNYDLVRYVKYLYILPGSNVVEMPAGDGSDGIHRR